MADFLPLDTYDALNRLDLKTYVGAGQTFDYVYDAGSRLTDLTDPTGVIHHVYDALNRLTAVTTTPSGGLPPTTVASTYDALGNRTSLTYPDATSLTSTYDALNRLVAIRQPPSALATFSYDALSRRTTRRLKNYTDTDYVYDPINRLLDLRHSRLPLVAALPQSWHRVVRGLSDWLLPQAFALSPKSPPTSPQDPISELFAAFTYTYDALGNRLTMTTDAGLPTTATHTYAYDPLSQVTSVDYPPAFPVPDTTYDLDSVGNRLTVTDGGTTTYVPNSLNQYASVGGITFTYDLNGNLTFDGLNTYTYDRENHLLSATGAFGSVTYTYDAFGRRTKKVLNGTTTRANRGQVLQ